MIIGEITRPKKHSFLSKYITEKIIYFINNKTNTIMKEELILKAYEVAKERYAAIGVDVEKAMDALQKISLSLCV